MKDLQEIGFDLKACRRELEEFRQLLGDSHSLTERDMVLPFFNRRLHLSAFLSCLNPKILTPDRIAFEFDLFGDFACDIVVGDRGRMAYCFIEFEEGKPSSLFV
jgi:hypothetical protein